MVRLVPGDSISLERAGCPQGMAQVQQVTETELCRLAAGFLKYLLTTNKFWTSSRENCFCIISLFSGIWIEI